MGPGQAWSSRRARTGLLGVAAESCVCDNSSGLTYLVIQLCHRAWLVSVLLRAAIFLLCSFYSIGSVLHAALPADTPRMVPVTNGALALASAAVQPSEPVGQWVPQHHPQERSAAHAPPRGAVLGGRPHQRQDLVRSGDAQTPTSKCGSSLALTPTRMRVGSWCNSMTCAEQHVVSTCVLASILIAARLSCENGGPGHGHDHDRPVAAILARTNRLAPGSCLRRLQEVRRTRGLMAILRWCTR